MVCVSLTPELLLRKQQLVISGTSPEKRGEATALAQQRIVKRERREIEEKKRTKEKKERAIRKKEEKKIRAKEEELR